ncbi:uncharacterized protein BDFB_000625 [Asbolus verrucosus]|uniref:Ku domain-containing protein n=1 Tax=Asbolus verrucosus TaxID=1661398 RepID=A0A482VHE6_ASBVE|nr:uncharacterized protein BDFB_000625 [Asbolus verrucosus]
MPAASKKDCSVILFDLATQCKEKAVQTLLKICCNNFFVDSKDLTKLILVNSSITENRLEASHSGYKHIYEVAKDIMPYNPRLILEMVENAETGEANWLEAVAVGLENLNEEYQDIGGIVTYQLLFITDLASPLPNAEDESVEIEPEDVKSGIMRHGKFVLMPDNKMFQVQNPRSFSVLCFTNSANVPEYIMRGEACYCVLPNGTPENNEAMAILIDCLAKQNKYVIARRVYNNNFIPKIVVLVPKPEHNPKCFLLTSLPFAEDIRYDYKEKNVEAAPKIDAINEVYQFLDGINIENDKCEKKVPLGVTMMLDTNCQKLINKATDKYLEKYMALGEVDTDYLMEIAPSEAAKSLKNIWEERKVDEVKKTEDTVGDNNSDDEFDW